MRTGKPYISGMNEVHGKECLIPVNPTYRELLHAVKVLGIQKPEDESDMRVTRYVSRLPEQLNPTLDDRLTVDETGKRLSELTDSQADAVIKICTEFGLKFKAILPLLNHIPELDDEGDYVSYDYNQ
jgi:hypothetical protein